MKRILLILLAFCFVIATEAKAQSRLYPLDYSYDDCRYLNKNLDNFTNFAFDIRPGWILSYRCCFFDASDSTIVLRNVNYFSDKSLLGLIKKLFGKTKFKTKVEEYRCSISPKATKCLRELFLSAIYSSSSLASVSGFDGETYRVYVERFGSFVMAECFSPSNVSSNCGKLVEILYSISDAIKQNNPQAIENLIPMAEELTESFKSLYPEEYRHIKD